MESALDQKLDLSALHLGTISLGKLLGALLTLVMLSDRRAPGDGAAAPGPG
ncbi:MAG: hypothetical protein ACLU38_16140 [Dysosmobacter sp.]